MRLETTMECPVETLEMTPALDRVVAAAGLGANVVTNQDTSTDLFFSDLTSSLLAKRGRDVEDEEESDDEDEDFDDEEDDEEDDLDDEDEDEDEEEEDEEEFEEEFDDDELDDDDDIFYDDDEDE